jgi:hypothetical protein
MNTRIASGISRTDVIPTDSAPRVTPQGGIPFKDMVARGAGALLRGAQAAVTSLPGAPIVAAAVRPGGTSGAAPLGGYGTGGAASLAVHRPGTAASPVAAEGPTGAAGTASPEGASSVEGALAQSQEFNLYYLQLQEQLAAENRSYSAMSNVLKARHDTIKNAIGNIR